MKARKIYIGRERYGYMPREILGNVVPSMLRVVARGKYPTKETKDAIMCMGTGVCSQIKYPRNGLS